MPGPPVSPLFPYTTLFRSSGGEKQRVAIARTLLKNPPILMLDEATSALDSRTEQAIQETLDKVAESRCAIMIDRKSTRLNSSHVAISYAVFCLKKKKTQIN